MQSARVLVTGATGFIGRHLIPRLRDRRLTVRCAVRTSQTVPDCESAVIGDLATFRDFYAAVEHCDAVVHMAGRAHIFEGGSTVELFRAVNTEATLALAEAAAAAGVRKFMFVSTIGVHDVFTNNPVNEKTAFAPADPYGASKLESERGLMAIAERSALKVTIIRPPLVYGPNCPGNLRRLAGLVARGLPLPFASIHNRRSMIAVDNLCDILVRLLDSSATENEAFVVADAEAVSTPGMIRYLADGMQRRAKLLPFPIWALALGARSVGYGSEMQKIVTSLEIDATKLNSALNWTPLISAPEGLRATGRSFGAL